MDVAVALRDLAETHRQHARIHVVVVVLVLCLSVLCFLARVWIEPLLPAGFAWKELSYAPGSVVPALAYPSVREVIKCQQGLASIRTLGPHIIAAAEKS